MKKVYLHGYNITDARLIRRLETCKYFAIDSTKEDLYGNIHVTYKFTGYRQPLLCSVSDNFTMIHSPYDYMGNYTYNGEDKIVLHNTCGHFDTYRKIDIFGVPFMVKSNLSNDDCVLAAETDYSFIKDLIKAL